MTPKKIENNTLEFIYNWQKRTEKQQRNNAVLLVVSLVVALALCIATFFWYQEKNYDRIVNQNMKYVQDSAIQEANQIESKLNDTVKQINNFAAQYALLIQNHDDKTTEEKLIELADKNLFDSIGFAHLDGTGITPKGSTNIADRSYFKKGLEGKGGYEFIDASRVTGRPSMVFYSPVKLKGKIMGIMLGFYEMEKVDDLFSYEFFNFKPNSYLIKRDGTVIANSNDKEIKVNILHKLEDKQFSGETDFEEIQKAIDSEERTSVSYSYIDNGKTFVGVIAQFEDTDWMVVSVLPDDITENMITNANNAGVAMMIWIIIIFLLIVTLLIVMMKHQRRKLEKEMNVAIQNLKTAVEHDQKQSYIIESLANTYSNVYYVDILTGNYEKITEQEDIALDIPDNGKWEVSYSGYLNKFVDDSYEEEMKQFLDIQTVKAALEDEESLTMEYQRKDKGWRRAIIIPAEYNENNEITSVIFAVHKIEKEKKREQETKLALQDAYEAAQMANKAKTIFLSNMSHDIRTPMNAIICMTAIAAANLDNKEKISDCLAKITSSSKHLLSLINEVLDMSKIESGKMDLTEDKFSLSKLIDDLMSIHQPLISEKKHTLIIRTNNLIHENVIGDSTRLQQVFTNLMTNAIKYTPDGGRLEITVTEKSTNKSTVGWYEVVFKDNGIGMSEEYQKSLFEPFSRAKDNRITAIQGTGLGMPIARNIIRMMNGDIKIESKINEGSTFTVSFALKLQKEEKENYDKFMDLPILVVDDDIASCESTCVILDSLSMKGEWVTSGREAVEKAVYRHNKKDDYYALIIDWKMPDMNGIETTREIRKQIGDDVPIIVISAYDWSDIEQEAKQAGVNAFLSKPLFKSKLVKIFTELAEKDSKEENPDHTDELMKRDFSGKRILLAEDNELNREIVVEILNMMGLEIETAENGQKCVEMFSKAQKGYYDLIFMDIQMPVMNGYDAAKAIRDSAHPQAKTIPIVAMTANAFSTDVRAAFDAGMNGHVSKPIDIDVIIKTLEEHLL